MNLEHTFAYSENGTLPAPMEKLGIKGLAYPKYRLEPLHLLFRDHGLCAYGHSSRMERGTVGRRGNPLRKDDETHTGQEKHNPFRQVHV